MRFIPAYAGNSKQSSTPNCAKTVHPRLRGELSITATAAIGAGGSSPLTRGTRHSAWQVGIAGRFIPAYAGNSISFHGLNISNPGSSPLTRGTLCFLLSLPVVSRFIPAYAGNSAADIGRHGDSAVHPRLRRELCKIGDGSMTTSGSSPLTRGTLTFCNPPNIQCRFIPAYAGNSLRRRGKESVRPVHPRLRGELSIALARVVPICRFIPAYAGNSNRTAKERELQVGSSPLTRGTPARG